jgi:Zn-dependent peptidase ImmA (M78 family)
MPSVRQNVKELLKQSAVKKPPVPVERIAQHLGLDVRYAPFEGDLSGALIRTKEETYIGVNSFHHSNRQRFTIAHEIAHYLLHKGLRVHIDKEFWVNYRDEELSKAVKWQEIEANKYAAELLMPTDFVVRDINKLKRLDKQAMQILAKRYKVSPQAMQITLANLGLVIPDAS